MQRKACNTHNAAGWLDLVFAHSNKCTTACSEVERSRAIKEFILPLVTGSTSSYFSVSFMGYIRYWHQSESDAENDFGDSPIANIACSAAYT